MVVPRWRRAQNPLISLSQSVVSGGEAVDRGEGDLLAVGGGVGHGGR